MRYRIYGQKRYISIATTIKLFSFTFFFGILIFCGFSLGSWMISSLTSYLNTIPINQEYSVPQLRIIDDSGTGLT